jgi:hypothetical protein
MMAVSMLPAAAVGAMPYIKVEQHGGVSSVTNAQGVVTTAKARGTVLINPDTTQRAVANLEVTSDYPSFTMFDAHLHQADLQTRNVSVLLQPGQELPIPDRLTCGRSQRNNPNHTYVFKNCVVNLSYKVLGSYTPRSDLYRLDQGVAEDYLRLYITVDQFDPPPPDDPNICRKGGVSQGFTMYNMLLGRSLFITYQYTGDDINWHDDTRLLPPGQGSMFGCGYRHDRIRIKSVRFAD